MLRFASAVCLFVLNIAVTAGLAQGQTGKATTGSVKSALDGRAIHYSYFPTKDSSDSAGVVILLHGKNGDRLVWEQKGTGQVKSFVDVLLEKGYSVVTVDMRKHGESKTEKDRDAVIKPNDYKAMLVDLEAIKEQLILNEHQGHKLNMNKTAIIAADDMAPVAASYALIDWQKPPYDDAPATDPAARTPRGQDIRALVLLSPSSTAGPLNLMGPLKTLRNPPYSVAIFVAYGTLDTEDKGSSRSIERALGRSSKDNDNEQIVVKDYETKFRGTDLTAKRNILVELPILQFLDKNLKQLDSEWRDRRNQVTR